MEGWKDGRKGREGREGREEKEGKEGKEGKKGRMEGWKDGREEFVALITHHVSRFTFYAICNPLLTDYGQLKMKGENRESAHHFMR